MWHDPEREPKYSEYIELDLGDVVRVDRRAEASAGPHRADRREVGVPQGHSQLRRGEPARRAHQARRGRRRVLPGQRSRGAVVRRQRHRRCRRRRSNSNGRPSNPVDVKSEDRGEFILDHGAVVIAAITSCTNTSNPEVMLGAALLASNAVEKGLTSKPWVKTTMAPGFAGGHRLLRQGRALAVSGEARLLPGRLRLHHLHRQLRSAARGDQQGDQRLRPVGRRGAVGQPQLRGPHQPRREDELPGVAAAGDRLRAGGHHGLRLRVGAARAGQRRQRRLPEGHLAVAEGHLRHHRLVDQPGDVHQELRRRVQGRRALAQPADPERQHVRVGRELDLRAQAPVLRRHARRAGAGDRHQRRQSACAAG